MVGTIGFEPTTSCSQSMHSSQTELRPELINQGKIIATIVNVIVLKIFNKRHAFY